MTRLARLAAGLAEPLLVTDARQRPLPDGLRELEQRAARRARRATTTLYTDFRYARGRPRDRRTSTFEPDASATSPARSPSCSRAGASGSRRCRSRTSQWETIGSGGAELVPTTGARRGAPRGQGRERARGDPPRRRDLGRRLRRRSRSETIVGRTEVERRVVARADDARARRRGAGVRLDRRRRRERRPAARATPRRRRSRRDTLVTVDMGCVVDGYRSDCTRTFATGDLAGAARRGLRPRRAGAAGRSRRGSRRAPSAATSTLPRASRSPRPGWPTPTGTGSATASGSTSTRRRTLRPESTDTLAAGNVVTVEPGLYLAGRRRLQDRGPRRRDRGRLRDPVVVHEGDAGRRLAGQRRRLDPEERRQRASASSRRDVSPQAPSELHACRSCGRRPARPARRGGRRRAAAGRSSRTRAWPAVTYISSR